VKNDGWKLKILHKCKQIDWSMESRSFHSRSSFSSQTTPNFRKNMTALKLWAGLVS